MILMPFTITNQDLVKCLTAK